MIAIPSVRHRLEIVLWHGPSLLGKGVGDPLFALAVLVEGFEVDAAARSAVVLADHHHPVAPNGGFEYGFDDAQADVTVKVVKTIL